MPWGWECRQRLIRQQVPQPAQRRGPVFAEQSCPGPQAITLPPLIGGDGYSHVRRAPAYSFGHVTPAEIKKPAIDPKAPQLAVHGLKSQGGKHKVKGGIMLCAAYDFKSAPLPGPAHYKPHNRCTWRRPPRYSIRPRPRPPYVPQDSWAPGANMYNPKGYDRVGANAPAHSIVPPAREPKRFEVPGPGAYNQNDTYVKRTVPRFSFGLPISRPDHKRHVPAPNAHCEKLFKAVLSSSPAVSFGIKHSPFLPAAPTYLLPGGITASAAAAVAKADAEVLARDIRDGLR